MGYKEKLNLLLDFKNDYKKLRKYSAGYRKPLFGIILLENIVYSSGILLAIVSKNILDFVIDSQMTYFALSIILYGTIIFTTLFISNYLKFLKVKLSENLTNNLQQVFLSTYYSKDWFEVYNYHSGDIVTRLTRDIKSIVAFFTSILPSIIGLVFQLVLAFIVAVSYDKTLGLFGLFTLPIITIISLVFGDKMKKQQHSINQKEGEYRSYLTESAQNVLIVKTFQNERSVLSKVIKIQVEKLHLIITKTKTTIFSSMIIEIGYSISSFVAFGWGAYRISQGIITFGMFTAIIQLIARMQAPIMALSKLLPQYISSTAAVDRCSFFLDGEQPALVKPKIESDPIGIEISNLSFSYTSDINILKNININIKPCDKVAIIGKSGIGKTTLLKLIMNLYNPNEGEITIRSEYELKTNSPNYYSYVPQGNSLFSGSIRSNLLIGNPDATDDEIFNALDSSCALDFVQALSGVLDTNLGEQGHGLSEGQLQRICIARALLRKAPVLLLDEATSSLDQHTEEQVLSKIYQNYPQKTVIAITHRPSILDYVDYTVELN